MQCWRRNGGAGCPLRGLVRRFGGRCVHATLHPSVQDRLHADPERFAIRACFPSGFPIRRQINRPILERNRRVRITMSAMTAGVSRNTARTYLRWADPGKQEKELNDWRHSRDNLPIGMDVRVFDQLRNNFFQEANDVGSLGMQVEVRVIIEFLNVNKAPGLGHRVVQLIADAPFLPAGGRHEAG